MPVTLHASQVRGARAMLAWSMVDLSRAARISVATIKRLEQQSPEITSSQIVDVILDVFGSRGVRFLPDDGSGPGVRLGTGRTSVHPERGFDQSRRGA